MIILGIDPGIGRVGYGIIRKHGSQFTPIAYGLIETPQIAVPDRLKLIHTQVTELIQTHSPDCLATERLLFTKNQTTAMDVAKALGCILLAAAEGNLPHTEYSPPEVKQSVTGTGNADKKQVQFMVTRLLGLQSTPKPDDIADALAIAITHAMRVIPNQAKAAALSLNAPKA
ncbi:MAG: crossover junction endodeoxyribonuclease RuvC [Fimbriimonadaceae bacterium]